MFEGKPWALVVEGVSFLPWETIYLITKCEEDLRQRRVDPDKKKFINELKNKLQSLSVGEKPFNIQVKI